MQHQPLPSKGDPSPSQRPKTAAVNPLCNYSHRTCMQNKIQGFEYCIKHVLEDTNAPFKQCNYVSNKTGKGCTNAAVKIDRKDGYCTEHARRTIQLRMRANRKRKPVESAHQLLEELEMQIPKSSNNGAPRSGDMRKLRQGESIAARTLEYASSSESESEANAVDSAWLDDCDSDAESIDSEQEDPLKHAGVYTAEEVALIARDKMIRLQLLYIDQFKRLQHMLKEKRRRYLHAVTQDRQQHGSISSSQDDPEQKDLYDKLQAIKRYHRRYGTEALLHRRNKERRLQVSEGSSYQPPSYPECIHSYEGTKCGERTIPLSKYCMQHILQDDSQVLFQACSFKDGVCERPVPTLNSEKSVCSYHKQLEESQYDILTQPINTETEIKTEDDNKHTAVELQAEANVSSEIPLVVNAHNENQSVRSLQQKGALSKKDIPLSVADLADEQTMSGTEDTEK